MTQRIYDQHDDELVTHQGRLGRWVIAGDGDVFEPLDPEAEAVILADTFARVSARLADTATLNPGEPF
jgi:hypothetical protein